MKPIRLRGLRILLLVFCSFPFMSYGSGFALARNAVVSCDSLLAAAMQSLAAGEQPRNLSESARQFLMFVELGLNNLGSEVPAFVQNLQQTVDSPSPHNPFLDLKSPLSLALSSRAELLLPQVDTEWSSIVESINQNNSHADSDQRRRSQDRRSTRSVRGLIPIPIDTPQDFSGSLAFLEYVGQTDEYFIFAKYVNAPDSGAFYRVSKAEPRLKRLKQIHVLPRSEVTVSKWVKDGFVFGIEHRYLNQSFGIRMFDRRLFRLDPSTSEVQWAESWDDLWHVFRRVQSSDTVVGIKLDPSGSGIGRVFRFDDKSLTFVPTQLHFDSTKFRIVRTTDDHPFDREVEPILDPAIDLGPLHKTDGYSILPAGESADWQDWTIPDWIRNGVSSAVKANPNDELVVQVNEVATTYADSPSHFAAVRSVRHTGRAPIFFSFTKPAHYVRDQLHFRYEPIPGGTKFLYFARYGSFQLAKLMIIDRASWQEQAVPVVGGPSVDRVGRWKLFRNRQNEILLQFEIYAQVGEVALWKFNHHANQFELQVHETFDNHTDGDLGARLDYETKELVGWTLDGTLLMNLLYEIQQEDGPR